MSVRGPNHPSDQQLSYDPLSKRLPQIPKEITPDLSLHPTEEENALARIAFDQIDAIQGAEILKMSEGTFEGFLLLLKKGGSKERIESVLQKLKFELGSVRVPVKNSHHLIPINFKLSSHPFLKSLEILVEEFKSENTNIRAISEEHPLKAITNRIWKVVYQILIFICGKDIEEKSKTNADVALNAEYLSRGAYTNITALRVSEKLQQVTPLFQEGAPTNFCDAFQRFTDLLQIENDKKANANTVQQLKALKIGECVILKQNVVGPSRSGHAMTGMVVRNLDDSFTYYQCNSGLGINHHDQYIKNGVVHYQQTLIIKDLSYEVILDFIKETAFLNGSKDNIHKKIDRKKLTTKELTHSLYARIEQMGGVRVILPEDSLVWTTGQKGGSCAGGAHKALLSAVLTPLSFEMIEKELRKDALFKIYTRIQKGADTRDSSKVAALDIISTLEQQGLESDQEIGKIKQYLEEMTFGKKQLKLSEEISKIVFVDYKQSASQELCSLDTALEAACYHYVSKNHEKARDILITWFPKLQAQNLTPLQQKKLLTLAKVIQELTDQALPIQPVYLDLHFGIIASLTIAIPSSDRPDFLKFTTADVYWKSNAPTLFDSPWKSALKARIEQYHNHQIRSMMSLEAHQKIMRVYRYIARQKTFSNNVFALEAACYHYAIGDFVRARAILTDLKGQRSKYVPNSLGVAHLQDLKATLSSFKKDPFAMSKVERDLERELWRSVISLLEEK